jgi:ABC-type polysaccharide/polyol phosphate export permease
LSESERAFLIVYYTALIALTAAALYVREEVFKSTLQVAVFVMLVVTSIIFPIAIRLKSKRRQLDQPIGGRP